jgi:hypothetical protein
MYASQYKANIATMGVFSVGQIVTFWIVTSIFSLSGLLWLWLSTIDPNNDSTVWTNVAYSFLIVTASALVGMFFMWITGKQEMYEKKRARDYCESTDPFFTENMACLESDSPEKCASPAMVERHLTSCEVKTIEKNRAVEREIYMRRRSHGYNSHGYHW